MHAQWQVDDLHAMRKVRAKKVGTAGRGAVTVTSEEEKDSIREAISCRPAGRAWAPLTYDSVVNTRPALRDALRDDRGSLPGRMTGRRSTIFNVGSCPGLGDCLDYYMLATILTGA